MECNQRKMQMIVEISNPIRVFKLILVNEIIWYQGKFLPNVTDVIQPMLNLLKKGIAWNWMNHIFRSKTTVI